MAFALTAPMVIDSHAARADELSDLRANQQLLQQRLDQVAQAMVPGNLFGVGGPPGPTNVQMMGGSFPRSFLIPGTDTSIRVGGEAREVLSYWFNGGNPNASPQSGTIGETGQAESIPVSIGNGVAIGNGQAVARARSTSIFNQTPYESKMNVETRTPTAWGEARTFIEFDFSGSTGFSPGGANPLNVSDSLVPRLRYAYGTLGGVLAGQANSNFADPDANGEAIDFGGNAGEPGVVRIPQVRYTLPLTAWSLPGAFSVSAETPSTEAVTGFGMLSSDSGAVSSSVAATTTGAGNAAASIVNNAVTSVTPVVSSPNVNPTKATTPDLTAAWYIPQAWGHVDFGGVIRPGLEFDDGLFVNRSYVGWGVHFGGDVKPGWFGMPKDDIIWHFVYGDGIGRYLNASTNFALLSNYPAAAAPATAAQAASVIVTPTVEWGGEIGYQHWWAPNLRSNINAGINYHEINSRLAGCTVVGAKTDAGNCNLNKEILTAHANLIWNPVPFVDVGIEYVYGHRVVLGNLKGDENVLTSKFGVKF
jgi:hypothetical protein